MKLGVKSNDFFTNAELHGNFRVANNSAMQKILSDSLYQDKVQSVIREISCNALDAHIQAGILDKPISVTIPTNLEPVFAVRDFGYGLSLEELQELYTVYGVSTKRSSDDAVGAFGLGSKSPFSYTKMWNVISRHNGMKYVICNSINAKGSFCYDVLHQEECDEPSGLEVRFDVDKNDIGDFKNKAAAVFRFFPTRPQTNVNLDIRDVVYEHKTDDYGILTYDNYQRNSYVICGPVCYPLDYVHFNGRAKTILQNCSIHVFANIGDVGINPGRESLSYDKFTIAKITEVLERCYLDIEELAQRNAAACKTLWEARLFTKKYFNGNNYLGRILNNQIKFNGKQVTFETSIRTSYQDAAGNYHTIQCWSYKKDHYAGTVRESKKEALIRIEPETRFAIYENGGYAAAKRYVVQNPDIKLYVFQEAHKKWLTDTVGVAESDLMKTSAFPAAVRQARAKSTANILQCYKFYPQVRHTYSRGYWLDESVDLDNDSGYYIPIKQFECNGVHPNELQEHVDGINLIGVLEARMEKFQKSKNWTHIQEYLKTQLDKLVQNPGIIAYGAIDNIPHTFLYIERIFNQLIKKDTNLAKAISTYKEYKKYEQKIREFKTMRQIYEKISGLKYKVAFNPISLRLTLDDYPMLELISYSDYGKQKVIDYINQIDKTL